MEKVNIDLHAHLATNWNGMSQDRALSAIESAGLDGIALVNFGSNDLRYEALASRSSADYVAGKCLKNATVYANRKTGKPVYLIRAQEVRTLDITDEGKKRMDLLFLATDKFTLLPHCQQLESTLKAAETAGIPIIACRTHLPPVMKVDDKRIIKYRDYFTGIEAVNGNVPHKTEMQIVELEAKFGRFGLIADSDSHSLYPGELGCYSISVNLDFSDESSLKDSIKERIKSGEFIRLAKDRPQGYWMVQAGGHMVKLLWKALTGRLD